MQISELEKRRRTKWQVRPSAYPVLVLGCVPEEAFASQLVVEVSAQSELSLLVQALVEVFECPGSVQDPEAVFEYSVSVQALEAAFALPSHSPAPAASALRDLAPASPAFEFLVHAHPSAPSD